MRKLILSSIFIWLVNIAFSQTRLAMDNKRLDSLTRTLKTYSVIVIVNDTVSKNARIYEIVRELKKHYAFLKNKKLKSGATDFEIRVNLNARIIGSELYNATSTTTNSPNNSSTYITHNYSIEHLVSSRLIVLSNGATLVSINLDSNVTVKRTHSYAEKIGDYSWASITDARNRKEEDRQYAEKRRREVSELYRFEKDFFYVFERYRHKFLVSSF